MTTLWHDLRYGLRMLAKKPRFTVLAVLTLALGIGANTTIFSMVSALLLRPLPGRDPGQLVTIYTSDYSGPRYSGSSYPDYIDLRDDNDVLSALAAHGPQPLVITSNDQSDRILGELVTANYFETLGVGAAYGRTFAPEEDQTPGAHPVVVLSHGLWKRRFGSDPSFVGKTVRLNGRPFTVIGVAAEGFTGLIRGIGIDLWVPIAMQAELTPGRSSRLENRPDSLPYFLAV